MLYATGMSDNVLRSNVSSLGDPLLICLTTRCRLNYPWISHTGKAIALAAPTYIDTVMSSLQRLVEDENVFPAKTSTHASICSSRSPFSFHFTPSDRRPNIQFDFSDDYKEHLSPTPPRFCTHLPSSLCSDLAPPRRASL